MGLKKKEIAIVFTAGLGNTILWIPAIRALKQEGFVITGVFTSAYNSQKLFQNTSLFNNTVVYPHKYSQFFKNLFHFRKYDHVILDVFASNKKHVTWAKWVGKKTMLQNTPSLLHKRASNQLIKQPKHNALLNMDLVQPLLEDMHQINFELISIPQKEDYIVFQPFSGNNTTPWKNWPLEQWKVLFSKVRNKIVVIGDSNEKTGVEEIKSWKLPNVEMIVGKTTLTELVNTIGKAQLYLGHDSGPMHIAVATNTPTFTLWGGSDKQLFAYDQINRKKNFVAYSHSPCHPCDSWLNPNTSKTSTPKNCPDFSCIRSLQAKDLLSDFQQFCEQHGVEFHSA